MKLLRRIDYWLHWRERDAELSEELDFHRAMSNAPAAFGNATRAREDARAIWIWPWLESVAQDLRYAMRNLRRQPGFTMIALVTLGAAIGLNTGLFTVFDAVALRMWPVRDPKHVVKIFLQSRRGPRGFPLAEARYLSDRAKSMSGLIAMNNDRVRMGFEGFGKTSHVEFVSGNFFQLLGVPIERGRGFLPSEDRLDAPENVVVLSYPVWRDHFGSDSAIVGKQVHLDDIPFTVVGVASEEFTGTTGEREDIWAPLASMQAPRPNTSNARSLLLSPNDCCSEVAGRLAPGFSPAQAQAELDVLSRQFHAQYKLDPARVILAKPTVLAAHSKRKNFLPVFGLMFAGLFMVLLLACVNISNLLIARAAARQREIEVRRALGAGRGRIIRQLLTEGFLLALAASGLGVALAWKLPAYVFALVGEGPNVRLTPDVTAIAYAALLAAIACIAFALAPALHGTRANTPRPRLPLRNVLLAAQVAMSVVLLIGADLMIAGVEQARRHDPGFRVSDITVISVELPAGAYDSKRSNAFSSHLLRELDAIESMHPLGIAAREPLANSHWGTSFRLPGESGATEHDIEFQEISEGYFDVLGIPVIAGRDFQSGDLARQVIVVNESMAHRYFENANPVGKSIIIAKQPREIVGVVRDACLTYVEGVGPLFFQPFTGEQAPRLLVGANSPGAMEIVSRIVRRLEPRARIQSAPLSENLDRMLAGSRTMAGIAGMLGVFALALAVIGMSGVFSYVVQQRTKEIGIRMALGAAPKQVIALVLAGTGRAACVGLAIGYVAAAGCAKLLAEYLYGVSPYHAPTYFKVAAILAISALAAAYFPVRRATHVDPVIALRVE